MPHPLHHHHLLRHSSHLMFSKRMRQQWVEDADADVDAGVEDVDVAAATAAAE